MAGGRTKDRRKTSAKTKRNSSGQCNKDTVKLGSSQLIWPFADSRRNAVYRELDVAELHWPPEDERELSQEIVRVNPLNQHSILQHVPSHKYILSHWGRTSSLVASDLVTKNSTRKGSPIKGGCTECTVNDTDSNNYWMTLSDEIILGIFKLLPKKLIVKCAQVCKHWQRLAYDESLWRCVDMTRVKNLPSGVLGKVIKRGTRVLRLALAEVDTTVCDDNASFFSDVVPLSPQSPRESMFSLRYLDASSCRFQGNTLLCLLLHSKQLTHISLESCTISTSVLRAMSDFHNLEVLNLAMCHGLAANGICSLAKSCSRLKQLNLAWTNLSKATILHVIKHLPGLQELNISGHRTTVNDDSIEILVTSCPSLTNLDLSDCVLITARSLNEICKLENLVHLNLSRCYNVAPVAFSCFTEMKSLKELGIFGLLNVEGLEVLKKELPDIVVNKSLFSSVARPVGSVYQGKIWGKKCKD